MSTVDSQKPDKSSTALRFVAAGLVGLIVAAVVTLVMTRRSSYSESDVPYIQSSERQNAENRLLIEAQRAYETDPNNRDLVAAQKRYDDYVNNNHIHAAYGIWDCTQPVGKQWLPPVNGENDADPDGIHAHADGLIHVHPFSKRAAGKGATLGKFFDVTGLKVSKKAIKIPAKDASSQYPEIGAVSTRSLKATTCASGKPGVIATFAFANVLDSDGVFDSSVQPTKISSPGSVRIQPNAAYVFALIEEGTIPDLPPSSRDLFVPSDLPVS